MVGAQTHGRFAMGCGVKLAPRNTPKLAEKKKKKDQERAPLIFPDWLAWVFPSLLL